MVACALMEATKPPRWGGKAVAENYLHYEQEKFRVTGLRAHGIAVPLPDPLVEVK
jgi:hypothetical protein